MTRSGENAVTIECNTVVTRRCPAISYGPLQPDGKGILYSPVNKSVMDFRGSEVWVVQLVWPQERLFWYVGESPLCGIID